MAGGRHARPRRARPGYARRQGGRGGRHGRAGGRHRGRPVPGGGRHGRRRRLREGPVRSLTSGQQRRHQPPPAVAGSPTGRFRAGDRDQPDLVLRAGRRRPPAAWPSAGFGRIISTSSIMASTARPTIVAYIAAKGGLLLDDAGAGGRTGPGHHCQRHRPRLHRDGYDGTPAAEPGVAAMMGVRTPLRRWGKPRRTWRGPRSSWRRTPPPT